MKACGIILFWISVIYVLLMLVKFGAWVTLREAKKLGFGDWDQRGYWHWMAR